MGLFHVHADIGMEKHEKWKGAAMETRHTTRSGKVLWLMLTMALLCSTGFAGEFWGIIGDRTMANFSDYETTAFSLCGGARIPSDAQWSMVWYRNTASLRTAFSYRTLNPISTDVQPPYDCSTEYETQVATVAASQAYVAMADANSSSEVEYDQVPLILPVPFWGTGRKLTLLHNGNNASNPWNYMGAGFVALDLFRWRDRTPWYNPQNQEELDSEFLIEYLTKYLLVAENYYWSDPDPIPANRITSPYEWAINHVVGWNPDIDGDYNGALTDGKRMVAWTFANSRPYTYYKIDPANLHFASVATGRVQSEGFQEIPHSSFIYLEPSTGNGILKERRQLPDPVELRANAVDGIHQRKPAIATDPKSSYFLAVWEKEGGCLQANIYNPMGLAEQSPFTLWNRKSTVPGSPSVAFSPNGDTAMVAWKERSTSSTTFQSVYVMRLTRSEFDYAWHSEKPVKALDPIARRVGNIDHPSVAIAADGSWAVVWEETLPNIAPARGQIRLTMYTDRMAITDHVIGETGVDHSDSDPVITYVAGTNAKFVMAWESQQIQPAGYNGIIVRTIAPNNSLGLTQRTVSINASGNGDFINPAIEKSNTVGWFELSYFDPFVRTIKSNSYEIVNTSGTLTSRRALNGPTMTEYYEVHPDIAIRAADTDPNPVDLCFNQRQSAGGPMDIYLMTFRQAGNSGPVRINEYSNNDQQYPAIAISQKYRRSTPGDEGFYSDHSWTYLFDQRRLMFWESNGQNNNAWAVSGKFYGVTASDAVYWYEWDPFIAQQAPPRDANNSTATLDENHEGNNPSKGSSSQTLIASNTCLLPNYPNPFNATTNIQFDIADPTNVTVQIFNMQGQVVATIADGWHASGHYNIGYNAASLSSGTYFIRMHAGDYRQMHKMLLIK